MAEKEGFEPSIPFWGIHDFQSCALGQLRDFSISQLSEPARIYYNKGSDLSRVNFKFFEEKWREYFYRYSLLCFYSARDFAISLVT